MFDFPVVVLEFVIQFALRYTSERALDIIEPECPCEVIEGRHLLWWEADREKSRPPSVLVVGNLHIGLILIFRWIECRLLCVSPTISACNGLERDNVLTHFLQNGVL